MKNIYTNNQFTGHYPVGTAAVVLAESPEEAARLLNHHLKNDGLEGDSSPQQFLLFAQAHPDEVCVGVRILCDGNY